MSTYYFLTYEVRTRALSYTGEWRQGQAMSKDLHPLDYIQECNEAERGQPEEYRITWWTEIPEEVYLRHEERLT